MNARCRLCSHPSAKFADAKIIGKYNIGYFMCNYCGFVQTEAPFWIDEVYSKAINDSDIGLAQRNIDLAKITKAIIIGLYDKRGNFVDYGGGYGLFVRIMRDKGFIFSLYDTYCENIFAKGFEAHLDSQSKAELLTAFEVFEHLVEPVAEIKKMLQFSDSIFFSTNIFPETKPMPGEWWYYGLEHGQHVSLYSYRSLQYIAQHLGLNLYSNKYNLHLLTKKWFSSLAFRLITRHPVPSIVEVCTKIPSLIPSDYKKITNRDCICSGGRPERRQGSS